MPTRFLALAPSLMYNSKPWKIHGAAKTFRCPEGRRGKQSITGLSVVPHKSRIRWFGDTPASLRPTAKVGSDNKAYLRIREWLDAGYVYEDILVLV
jgi:hypothetical protein